MHACSSTDDGLRGAFTVYYANKPISIYIYITFNTATEIQTETETETGRDWIIILTRSLDTWLNVGGIFNAFWKFASPACYYYLHLAFEEIHFWRSLCPHHFTIKHIYACGWAGRLLAHWFAWLGWRTSKKNDATAEKLHMMCVSVCRFKCRQSLLAVFSILKTNFHITLFFCARCYY